MACHHIHARVTIAVSRCALSTNVVDSEMMLLQAVAQEVNAVVVEFAGWVEYGYADEILSEGNQVFAFAVNAFTQALNI